MIEELKGILFYRVIGTVFCVRIFPADCSCFWYVLIYARSDALLLFAMMSDLDSFSRPSYKVCSTISQRPRKSRCLIQILEKS